MFILIHMITVLRDSKRNAFFVVLRFSSFPHTFTIMNIINQTRCSSLDLQDYVVVFQFILSYIDVDMMDELNVRVEI